MIIPRLTKEERVSVGLGRLSDSVEEGQLDGVERTFQEGRREGKDSGEQEVLIVRSSTILFLSPLPNLELFLEPRKLGIPSPVDRGKLLDSG